MERTKHLETTLVLVLALGGVYYFYHLDSFLAAAGMLGIAGLFFPSIAKLVHQTWMKFAEVLGYVTSKVLLGLVFVLIVIPLSLMSKVFKGRNGIQLKPQGSSHFKDRNFTYDKRSMENIW
jgi:hypothetical protein